jgi:hypothetical protein
MTEVYALSCEGGKYYIGKTKTGGVDKRFAQHLSGKGSAWTRQYPPVEMVYYKKCVSDWDEDLLVKQFMRLYGVDNVRGGSYVQLELKDSERALLQKELDTAENRCFVCSGTDHFAGACPRRSRLTATTTTTSVDSKRASASDVGNKPKCQRCQIVGHTEDTCYVEVDVDDLPMRPTQSVCRRCRKYGHHASTCRVRMTRSDFFGYDGDNEDSDGGEMYD